MQLGYTVLYVPDVSATVAFYETAFGLTRKTVKMEGRYAEMETGTTTLAFSQEKLMSEDYPDFRANRPDEAPCGTEISFFTDDVKGAYDKAIAAGAVSHVPPREHADGQWMAHLRDLNGNLVELCTRPAS